MNRCPSGLYFDDVQKFCTFKDEARCGPIPTSKHYFFVADKIFTKCNKYVNDLFLAVAPITEAPLDNAQRCNPAECELPYCYCSKDGTNIPKDLSAEEVS